MIVATLLLGLCQIITMICAVLLIKRVVDAKQAELEARLERITREWIEPQPEGRPSKLAVMVDAAGAVVGSAAARSLMAGVKQDASSVAVVANSMSAQIQAQQNPLAALLSGSKKGKGAAIMRLAELIGPMLGSGGQAKNGEGERPSQRSFEL